MVYSVSAVSPANVLLLLKCLWLKGFRSQHTLVVGDTLLLSLTSMAPTEETDEKVEKAEKTVRLVLVGTTYIGSSEEPTSLPHFAASVLAVIDRQGKGTAPALPRT